MFGIIQFQIIFTAEVAEGRREKRLLGEAKPGARQNHLHRRRGTSLDHLGTRCPKRSDWVGFALPGAQEGLEKQGLSFRTRRRRVRNLDQGLYNQIPRFRSG